VDVAALLDHLAEDGPLLRAAAERAGLDAPVPGLRWNVRELVTHTGGIHRWAADIVATSGHRYDTDAGRAVGTGPADAELLDWFAAGHTALVDTLRAASDDLDCTTFLPAPSPRVFWIRRQAHETAVHRADAEAAAGAVTVFAAGFAQDGIGELLQGFAARRANAIDTPATVALVPSDDSAPWRVRLGGERIVAEPVAAAPEDADLTVTGTASELYLWLWNRPSSAATVTGDDRLAARWAEAVRVRWG
jgi:uncharacterized protein (TIGR03083 family)